jgi:hypothetical protein
MATKTQNAETIALEARVFVRKARREGSANKLTRHLIQETAERLHISGEDYSVRTVQTILRREAALMGETHLLDF